MTAIESNQFTQFVEFVALLIGRSRRDALGDFDPDADASWAAELLLRGDDRGRGYFDPRRVDRAMRFAHAVGLLGCATYIERS
jgi:hypothetical protein